MCVSIFAEMWEEMLSVNDRDGGHTGALFFV